MHVVLQVTSDVQASQKIVLRPGQSINIGRAELNDYTFSDDARMAREHFVIEFSPDGCRLCNLKKKNFTTVNGQQVEGQIELQNGDEIVAGQTCFAVSLEGTARSMETETSVPLAAAAPVLLAASVVPTEEEPDVAEGSITGVTTAEAEVPAEPAEEVNEFEPAEIDFELDEARAPVLEYFQQLKEPLYAILDAARDSVIQALLIQSDHENQTLYEGIKEEKLADVGPFLVKLPPDSRLLKKLIAGGWGNSWGVFLTCDKPFQDIRDYLRQFLMVELPDAREVLFRFYDPRVLRDYLPTCLPEEVNQFFGPVASYFLEDESPENLVRLAADLKGKKEIVELGCKQS